MRLAKQIFTRKTIDTAINDYRELTQIKINDEREYWNINFFHCKYDKEVTEKEFENYLIGLENAYM